MVAVLMTDLVGSTAMADRVGPTVAERLRAEHFGLLRQSLERTTGREVKNLGDGLMVVFASAAQSLACAVQMQQAVEARNRRADEQFGLRIGVSVGDTTVEDGDYFGGPVVEAARLCAHAAGGQIVLNALVHQLAGSHDGHSFRSLGALELKGISESVPAFELQWEPAPVTGGALPERLLELPATGYVGRRAERERLSELWGQVCEGSLRLALIGGEAGVGKTRLSSNFALTVHGEGASVLYGRCDEDLGVPYQPWVQALEHLVMEAPQPVLDTHVERFGGDLARLVPTLGDRFSDLPAARESDPETERYLMYAAVAGLLGESGEREPLLLIIDDLHWADAPTLSLLRHVVAAGAAMRVMVIGTYRDSDLSRDHPLTALLADLHRERGVERVRLTGLEPGDVLGLMEAAAGHELDEVGRELAREITRETSGNPFFAVELLRHLTESGAIVREEGGSWHVVGEVAELGLPVSVREVIGRRVERLGADARMALSAAAVIGRDFDIELLAAVVDLPQARLLDLLEQAVSASLLQENGDRPGRFTFTHALVEHTLYEDLGRTRRALLHRQVAQALEEQCGDEPGERLGELAAHWAAAVVSSDTAKALHYARRAAEHALARLAPDEAARWYRGALELYDQASDGEASERCDLLIGLGEAERQAGDPAYRQTLLDAAEVAQQLDDADRLCRAVLANSRGVTSQLMGTVDRERVHALEAAAGALADDDPRRAQVLALLAGGLAYAGHPERCRRLAAEAIEIARAAGDPAALAHTLANACRAIGALDTLQERRRLSDELTELARHLDDPRLTWAAARIGAMVGLEAGDRSKVESGLATLREFEASVPEPLIAWARLQHESGWAIVEGDLEASERCAIEAYETSSASGQPDAAAVFGAMLAQVRMYQGRLGELAEQALRFDAESPDFPTWRATAALGLLQGGREDEARDLVLAEDFKNVLPNEAWSMAMYVWAMVCSDVHAVARAGELYELLAPFSGQIVAVGAIVLGSIDWALGSLATALQRYEQAERHFAAATEIDERLGAPLLLARTRAGWARALVAGGRPEDLDRAGQLLEQAQDTAARLGAQAITREVTKCRVALAAIGG
jgi:class 3 adenylate cyclase/tetratricopeptide (TPR) repeat protein